MNAAKLKKNFRNRYDKYRPGIARRPIGESAVHPLRKHLRDVSEPVSSFAARVGTNHQTLYRIFCGVLTPKPLLARRKVEATSGAVTFETLYGRREDRVEIILLKSPQDDDEELDATRLAVAWRLFAIN